MKELIYKRTYLVFFAVALILTSLFLFKIPVHAAPEDEEAQEEPIPVIIKPTLNASISDKALTINAESEKGIKAIYVNGYEFEPTDGNLKINLTRFDAGYEKFFIFCEDMEGVRSDIYEVENPYFDTNLKDTEDPSKELPTDADATPPSSATGDISEHIKSGGRDYYQIETKGGRTFYLIIDNLTDEEKVYFLTEISERDLLNATDDNSETLPRNSAVPEEGITPESVSTNNNAKETTIETVFGESKPKEKETKMADKINISSMSGSSFMPYAVIIIGGAAFFVILLLVKKKKKKKDSLDSENLFEDDEDEKEDKEDEERR